jgi:hypothetical protein
LESPACAAAAELLDMLSAPEAATPLDSLVDSGSVPINT